MTDKARRGEKIAYVGIYSKKEHFVNQAEDQPSTFFRISIIVLLLIVTTLTALTDREYWS